MGRSRRSSKDNSLRTSSLKERKNVSPKSNDHAKGSDSQHVAQNSISVNKHKIGKGQKDDFERVSSKYKVNVRNEIGLKDLTNINCTGNENTVPSATKLTKLRKGHPRRSEDKQCSDYKTNIFSSSGQGLSGSTPDGKILAHKSGRPTRQEYKKPVYLSVQNTVLPMDNAVNSPSLTNKKLAQYEFEVDSEEEKKGRKRKKNGKSALTKMRSKIFRESFVPSKNIYIERTSPVKTRRRMKNVRSHQNKENLPLDNSKVNTNSLNVQTNVGVRKQIMDVFTPKTPLPTMKKNTQSQVCHKSRPQIVNVVTPENNKTRPTNNVSTENCKPVKHVENNTSEFKVPSAESVTSTRLSQQSCDNNGTQTHESSPIPSGCKQSVSTPAGAYFGKNLQNHSTPLAGSANHGTGSLVGTTSESDYSSANCFGFNGEEHTPPSLDERNEEEHQEGFLSPVTRLSDIDGDSEMEVSQYSDIGLEPPIVKAAPSRFSLGKLLKKVKSNDFLERREKTTTVASQLHHCGPLSPNITFTKPPRRSYDREHVKRVKRKIHDPEIDSEEEDLSVDKRKAKRKMKKEKNEEFDKKMDEWASVLNTELSSIEDFELCVE